MTSTAKTQHLQRLQSALERWHVAILSPIPKGRAPQLTAREKRADALHSVAQQALFILRETMPVDLGSIGDVVSELDSVGAIVQAEQLVEILYSVPLRDAVTHDERAEIMREQAAQAAAIASGSPPIAQVAAAPVKRTIRYFSDGSPKRRGTENAG
jgi:hypothetical protein